MFICVICVCIYIRLINFYYQYYFGKIHMVTNKRTTYKVLLGAQVCENSMIY